MSKLQTNSKCKNSIAANRMSEDSSAHRYDLEERSYQFAKRVRAFAKRLPRTVCNIEDVKQLARSSGSIGANYIEANEALGKKDFLLHIRISRKEAKESRYWQRLIDVREVAASEKEREELIQESTELMLIFSAILRKSE